MLPVWSRFGEPKDAEVRVVVWNVFVPFELGTHHEGVADCDLPSLRHLEILVLRKEVQKSGIEGANGPGAVCDSNEREEPTS